MNEIRVIDLLNKIANGEEVPKGIKYNNINYYWCNQCKIYERIEDGSKDLYNDLDNLNDEVEILEEKKIPEKLKVVKDNSNDIVSIIYDDTKYDITILQAIIIDNINAIIDYLKSKGE